MKWADFEELLDVLTDVNMEPLFRLKQTELINMPVVEWHCAIKRFQDENPDVN